MKFLARAAAFLLMLPALCLAQGTVPPQDANGVPPAFLAKLDRGVNVTRWFCYVGSHPSESQLSGYFTDADWSALASLRVTFVRLCLSPDIVYSPTGDPNLKTLPYIDRALDAFERRGIAVLFDLHENDQLKLDAPTAHLEPGGSDAQAFIHFWESIAHRYAGQHETTVAFELLNEPIFKRNPDAWYDLQARAVRAIRAIDPARTIVVTGTSWSSIDALARMSPLPETNLIYTVHCYDPFYFTHQGASWTGDVPRNLKSIPFPATVATAAQAATENDPKYKDVIAQYGRESHNAASLKLRLTTATTWAHAHHVPLVLGEFGAYPLVSPPDSRARWFAAMRAAITDLKLPNALWGYDDALGLGRKLEGNKVVLDPLAREVLYGAGDATP
jgi:aryl-phospho-beta-D-glucosidase BglC (GH1 family)